MANSILSNSPGNRRLQLPTTLGTSPYLQRIAELAKKVEAGKTDDTPTTLDTQGKRALYNNLVQRPAFGQPAAPYGHGPKDDFLVLALRLDEAVKRVRPDGWRGVQAREMTIKRALYNILQNAQEVERIFLIIKQQTEY